MNAGKQNISKTQIEVREYRSKMSVGLVWAMCALVGFTLTAVRAQALPKTAGLVPPETVLLVEIDDFTQFRQQFEKTNIYKLYKDPAVAPFVNHLKEKLTVEMQKVDKEFFDEIIDANVLPSGRVALAMVLNERVGENEPAFVIITQWGQAIDKIKEYMDKAVKKEVEEGADRKSEDYRGTAITTVIKEGGSVYSYCFFGDTLIVSLDTELLKFVIAHAKGATSSTLAAGSDYNSTIAATGPYHDIDFYVNIKQIIKMIIAEDPSGKIKTQISNLGFDNIISAGYSIALGRRPGSCCSGKGVLRVDGAKRGVLRMLEFESRALKAPRFIPASVYSITFLNINIRKAYNELHNILSGFSPDIAAQMDVSLPAAPDEPPLQLKGDIIDHLGSEIILTQSLNKSAISADRPLPVESLFAVALSNRAALERTISILHGIILAPNNPDAKRELLGHTIYVFDPIGLPILPGGMSSMQETFEIGGPQRSNMAFTFTDTHLILGNESMVEGAIRTLSSSEAPSLDSAKWFTSTKLDLPSVVGVASLEDSAASIKLIWDMLRKQGGRSLLIPPGAMPGSPDNQQPDEFIKFDLLPQFDAVRKYFGPISSYAVSRPDGFFFEFNYLNPMPAATD